ncbi:MAG TPA: hypothetical protein VLC12_01315 [Terriglobales bacterium]|nr:hypothetical protein [Terriglobales bacterium]
MRLELRILAISLLSGLCLILGSCYSCSRNPSLGGGRGAAATPAPAKFYTPAGAVFQASYTSNTVRLDLPTVQKTLRSVSQDARVFVFDDSDPRVRELDKGKVMFLEHLGARRIVAVQKQGGSIALLTEPASLTDFIQDGRIEFSAPINFRRSRAENELPGEGAGAWSALQGWFGPLAVVHAEEEENKTTIGLHTKGEINNWQFEVGGEPKGDGFELSLTAIKKLQGFGASVTAKGELSHITTAFKAVIHNNKMDDFSYNTPLQGHLHVGWAALTEGENSGIGEARLKLPPFAKDVIDVYGVPLLFRIDENLIFKPGFGGKKDAASGGFDLDYDGSEGLEIHGGKSSPEGTMNAEPKVEKTTAESLAAHGVVLAVNAPKISVSFGTESVVEAIKEAMPEKLLDKAAEVLEKGPFGLGGLLKKPAEEFFKLEAAAYVQLVTEFDYTGSGPLSIVPCSITHLNFFAQAGADAQIGLVEGESPHVDISKTKFTSREPDIDACGPKS